MPNLIFNFSRFIGLKIIHFDSERNKPRIVRPKIMTKLYFRAVIWTIVLLYLRCYSLHWLPWLLHEYTAILKYALLSTRGRCGTAGGIARDSHSCGERAHLLQRAAVEAAHVCCTHLCAPRHGTWMENFWGLLSIESTFKGLVRSGTSTGTDVKKSGSPQVRFNDKIMRFILLLVFLTHEVGSSYSHLASFSHLLWLLMHFQTLSHLPWRHLIILISHVTGNHLHSAPALLYHLMSW